MVRKADDFGPPQEWMTLEWRTPLDYFRFMSL